MAAAMIPATADERAKPKTIVIHVPGQIDGNAAGHGLGLLGGIEAALDAVTHGTAVARRVPELNDATVPGPACGLVAEKGAARDPETVIVEIGGTVAAPALVSIIETEAATGKGTARGRGIGIETEIKTGTRAERTRRIGIRNETAGAVRARPRAQPGHLRV